jgi:predicted Zn-dependent protease
MIALLGTMALALFALPTVERTGRELAAAAAEAFERGRAEEAIQLLQAALKSEPGNSTYAAALGQIYLSTGKAELSVPLLRRALAAVPSDLDIRLALAQGLQNLGKDLEALRTLGRRPPDGPTTAIWSFLRGFSLFRIGSTTEAAKLFTALLAYPDMRAPAHFFLGNCKYVETDLAAAVPEFEAAIREGNVPGNKALNAYYYNYGLTLFRLGRYGDGAEAFRHSIERFSSDPLPHFYLARCLSETNAHEEAIAILEQMVAQHADFPPALYQLARLHASHGDAARARELFQRYSLLRGAATTDQMAVDQSLKLGR